MKTLALSVLLLLVCSGYHGNSTNPGSGAVTFKILYDNQAYDESCMGDWGFSCLIEGKEKTILFDSGTNPDIFKKNIQALDIDISEIDMIVISHNHGDHTGGLPVILEKRKDLPLYIPWSVEDEFLSLHDAFAESAIPVEGPLELCDGVMLTGEMGDRIKEQSLVVETERGLVILTGCSHQGVDNIILRVAELSDERIYLTLGGFHLLNHSEEQIEEIIRVFLNEGVEKCGATHCSGEQAIMMFRETYGEDFVVVGAGMEMKI